MSQFLRRLGRLPYAVVLALLTLWLWVPSSVFASSHQDAPLITLDPAANTTDVYSFVSERTTGSETIKYLTVALGVYPFEEPGVGPNKWNFDDNVLYEIHVATGADVAAGKETFSYQFRFTTNYKNANTILPSYLGVIVDVNDDKQNLTQTYEVTRVNHKTGGKTSLGAGIVPPNNQGIVTPFYNQGRDGREPARGGAATEGALDRYTAQSISQLQNGYRSFAGQRDDGFYGDILSIFDLLFLRNPGRDSQGGFNIHLMALQIPVTELGGDQQVVGVYATTSRQSVPVLGGGGSGAFVQVGRQGNPLFNEGFVAIKDKDKYSRTKPSSDKANFNTYALNPELAKLLNALVFKKRVAPDVSRTDIAGIFIPDLIKTDLSTPKARLAGPPDDAGFSRLSIFGGDVLQSKVQDPFKNGGLIPGGWPNGRRFGDDVVDIGITALASDLRVTPPFVRGPFGDNMNGNDMTYNKVFPYESTPQNGRAHGHH